MELSIHFFSCIPSKVVENAIQPQFANNGCVNLRFNLEGMHLLCFRKTEMYISTRHDLGYSHPFYLVASSPFFIVALIYNSELMVCNDTITFSAIETHAWPFNLAYVCILRSLSSHLRGLNKLFQWVNVPGATMDTPKGENAMQEPSCTRLTTHARVRGMPKTG